MAGRSTLFSSFKVRSFRFQWPADMTTTWAFDMETLILGWYILVETESVFLLTVFGALQFIGTLIAPYLGVVGDRLGRRTMLISMRASFAVSASVIMILSFTDMLNPYAVFAITFWNGLLRPSDMVMRNALVGDTMPANALVNALGFSRISMDSARIFGAMSGAGLFSLLGIGRAYIFVAGFYVVSILLTLGVSKVRPAVASASSSNPTPPSSHWRDLKEGFVYIWNTPPVLAIMWLAFFANLTAFPISHGLLPYVAREVYLIDENGLGHIVAAFAAGAVVGSLILAWRGGGRNSPRFMVINLLLWYVMLAAFSQFETKSGGLISLFIMGIVHSVAMVSMTALLLNALSDKVRGRVVGVRMLCVYGVPIGLLLAGVLIESVGFPSFVLIYTFFGATITCLIVYRWRHAMWR